MRLSTYTYTNLITTLCVIPPVTLFVIISLFSAFGKGVDKGRGLGRLKPDFFWHNSKIGGWSCKSGRGSAKISRALHVFGPPLLNSYLHPCSGADTVAIC